MALNEQEKAAAPKRRVGLVGVGLMGSGIAQNIVGHGHALTVLEHPGVVQVPPKKLGTVKTA